MATHKLYTDKGVERTLTLISYRVDLADSIALAVDFGASSDKTSKSTANKILSKGKEANSFILPLPNSIQDSYTQGWEKASNTGTLMDIAGQEKIQQLNQFTQSFTGYAINPFYYQMYTGQQPRSISLAFEILPQSKEEMIAYKKAVFTLKADMVGSSLADQFGTTASKDSATVDKVNTAAQESVLVPPMLFSLRFGKKDSFLNQALQYDLCVMESMSIDFGTDGAMAMFHDDEVKKISVNMTFSEYEPTEQSDWAKFK